MRFGRLVINTLIADRWIIYSIRNEWHIVYKKSEVGGEPMQAYCVKYRAKREMKSPKVITMKNGRPATQGVCPICGTKMFRIGKVSKDSQARGGAGGL